jgi:hypothetical protein
MRSRHKTLGEDKRQGSESPYLAAAIKYLTQNTQRPLWPGQRQIKNGLPETPNHLYRPLAKSRGTFIRSLNIAFKKYFGPNFPKDGEGHIMYNKQDFLAWYATRLNIPDLPPGYGLVSDFNDKSLILNKTTAEGLAAKLSPIGVEVLDNGARPRTAFPVAFLKILQGVIEEDSSLKEDHLIAQALLKYMKYLDEVETPDTAITEACMEVSSLALQRENLEAFLNAGLLDQLMEQLMEQRT